MLRDLARNDGRASADGVCSDVIFLLDSPALQGYTCFRLRHLPELGARCFELAAPPGVELLLDTLIQRGLEPVVLDDEEDDRRHRDEEEELQVRIAHSDLSWLSRPDTGLTAALVVRITFDMSGGQQQAKPDVG